MREAGLLVAVVGLVAHGKGVSLRQQSVPV